MALFPPREYSNLAPFSLIESWYLRNAPRLEKSSRVPMAASFKFDAIVPPDRARVGYALTSLDGSVDRASQGDNKRC